VAIVPKLHVFSLRPVTVTLRTGTLLVHPVQPVPQLRRAFHRPVPWSVLHLHLRATIHHVIHLHLHATIHHASLVGHLPLQQPLLQPMAKPPL